MSHPHQNWFFSEVAGLAERYAQAAKEAREAMKTPCALADASVHLSDDGRELVAQGDLAGYYIEARMPWPFDGDLPDAAAMLIRGTCEQQANSRDAGCRLIRIITDNATRRAA